MEAAFGDIVGTLKYDCQEKDLALNRWRAVLINDPSVYEVYMQKELLKQQKKIQKKRSKKEDTAATIVLTVWILIIPIPVLPLLPLIIQTKVSCMLCKNSFMRPLGFKRSFWIACSLDRQQQARFLIFLTHTSSDLKKTSSDLTDK